MKCSIYSDFESFSCLLTKMMQENVHLISALSAYAFVQLEKQNYCRHWRLFEVYVHGDSARLCVNDVILLCAEG